MSKDNSSNICLNVYTKYFDLKETKIIANNMVMNYGENKFLDITLLDINNNPIKNAEIILSINNNDNILNTDNNGKIRLPLKDIDASKIDININYWGDSTFDYSKKKVTVNINKLPTSIVCTPFTYNDNNCHVKLKSNNNLLANKIIYLCINGKTYNTKTNKVGIATFKASKTVFTGKSKFYCYFDGDTNYNPVKSNAITIKTLKIKCIGLKSKYKTSAKAEVKLSKKIVLKLKITVTINKKLHSTYFKTNKNGKAKINLFSKFKKYGLKANGKDKYQFKFLYNNKNNNFNVQDLSIKISFIK